MSDFFTQWVEGEKPVPLHAEFEPIEEKPEKKKRPPSLSDRQRLDRFLKLYAKCGAAISVMLLIVLSRTKDIYRLVWRDLRIHGKTAKNILFRKQRSISI